MSKEIKSDIIASFTDELESHPVYAAVETIEDLQCFMEHHVYSVWDFMSLIKYLQLIVAPARYPWVPAGDGNVRRFINELVLEEESDETREDGKHSSHFELYQNAMKEIGADTEMSVKFVHTVAAKGLQEALALPGIPVPSRLFTGKTFHYISDNKPHEVAAALALGREHIIPSIFRSILKRMQVSEQDAPTFHYYLSRHIHLDEYFHAPLSLNLLNSLCAGNETRINEAIDAAKTAVEARLQFWDGVLEAIENRRGRLQRLAG